MKREGPGHTNAACVPADPSAPGLAASLVLWARARVSAPGTDVPHPPRALFVLGLASALLLLHGFGPPCATAAPALVKKATGVTNGGTSVTANFPAAPAAGNLLVAVAGNRNAWVLTGPTLAGWDAAIDQSKNSPGQVIYYKISNGTEASVTVSGYDTSTRLGLHIYEYSGVDSLIDKNSNSGSGTAVSTSGVTATGAGELVFAAVVHNISANVSPSFNDVWGSSFSEQNDFINGGAPASRTAYGAAHVTSTGAGGYSTTTIAGASGAWRTQTVVFKLYAPDCPDGVVTNTENLGPGSLRDCIAYANQNPGSTVSFNIPLDDLRYTGTVWRITPAANLPAIKANNTVIDGSTQRANQGDRNPSGPEIEIVGTNLSNGIKIDGASNVTLREMVVNQVQGNGVYVTNAATWIDILGSYIGTNVSGTAASANTGDGIKVDAGSSFVTIGGSGVDDGNVISGNTSSGIQVINASNVTIRGNKIGTNRAGTAAVGNGIGTNDGGVHIQSTSGTRSNLTIGGSAAGAGNIISGNNGRGIWIDSSAGGTLSNLYIYGNTIGTGVTGSEDLGNTIFGVASYGGSAVYANLYIGGVDDGEGNLIAHTKNDGVSVVGNISNGYVDGNTIRDSDNHGIYIQAANVFVRKNTVTRNGYDGLSIANGMGIRVGTYDGVKIYNNTIHDNYSDGIYVAAAGTASIKNNILSNNGVGSGTGYGIWDLNRIATIDYNDIYANASGTCVRAAGRATPFDCTTATNNITTDPLYVNPGSNFQLQAASPAINKGQDLGADQPDMNGGSPGLWDQTAPDMGAYEGFATASTCTVTNTNTSGAGSLANCITVANGTPNTTIYFNIPNTDSGYRTVGGDSWWRISVDDATVLPVISGNGTVIDGTSQTTTRGNTNSQGPEIEIEGSAVTAAWQWGLRLTSSFNVVKGLVVNGFNTDSSAGIRLDGAGNNNGITGCYIGTNYAGISAIPNMHGIYIFGPDSNTVGGTSAALRNVVSGNTLYNIRIDIGGSFNVVHGNYIGTNASGTAAVGATTYGVAILSDCDSNQIGGNTPEKRNVISGHSGAGIIIGGDFTDSNVVRGNYIGTDVTGSLSIPNATGVDIMNNTKSNIIGGTLTGEGNRIAYNTGNGVMVRFAFSDFNEISGNSIYSNGGLGIRLNGDGANNNLAAPVITSVTPSGLNFNVVATGPSGGTIEFFRANNPSSPAVALDDSGAGEGYLFLGACVDNGACTGPHISGSDTNAAAGTYAVTLLSSGLSTADWISAVAIASNNDTSQFSANASTTPVCIVTNTTDAGAGSLRQCLLNAQGTPGTTVQFNIPPADPNYTNGGSGTDYWWRITPGTPLPSISANGTIIDGTTQTVNRGNTNTLGPEVEIYGASAGNADGFSMTSANNALRGLVISRFNSSGYAGVRIDGAGATGNTVAGCHIGTDAVGAAASANNYGVIIGNNAASNTIGGDAAADRNVISGNTTNGIYISSSSSNAIKGNYLGTNAQGDGPIPNVYGILLYSGATGTTIGGNTAARRNVISGNTQVGIGIRASNGTTVIGNYIGTGAAGTGAIANAIYGIDVYNGSQGSVIGTATANGGNIVAYSGSTGIFIHDAATDNNRVSGNSIFENGGLGIDLDGAGANNDKAAPTITSVTPSGGDFAVSVTVAAGDAVEFFRVTNAAAPVVTADGSGAGEGFLFLGRCTDGGGACSGPYIAGSDGAADGSMTVTLTSGGMSAGDFVTATATDAANGTSEFSANRAAATTTIGDGVGPIGRDVWAGGRFFGVDAFTLQTDLGSDTLTALTVTFSGTNVNDVAPNGVRIWKDNGTPSQWDTADTLIGIASFSGLTASFSGLSESITTTPAQYLVTYNVASTATPGNTLQGAVTGATVSKALVNNDTTDATLTVEADLVHETSVYKIGYSPGALEDLFLKQTSSPGTDLLTSMTLGSVYPTVAPPAPDDGLSSLVMSWDPDTTVTTLLSNSVVKRVQMSGRLMGADGKSYGSVSTIGSFYEDRMVFDVDLNLSSRRAGSSNWLFMTYAQWPDALIGETYWWTSNNTNSYTLVDPPPQSVAGSLPLSWQGLFQLGGTDGLMSVTAQLLAGFGSAQIKYSDPDTGAVDTAFQYSHGPAAALPATWRTTVIYSFNTTTTGFDTAITEARQDDSVTPAALNFAIVGGDGAVAGDGFAEERGAYTLGDGDDDDHVKFQFEPTTTHYAPVFEITGWGAAAPSSIVVGDAVKTLGTDYNAAVSGGVLYLQYLSTVSVSTVFELGGDIVSGTLYTDEGTTAAGAGVKVRLLVNGADRGEDETSGTGKFFFATPLNAADKLLVYVDEDDADGATDGTTVTVSDGNNLSGVDIYYQHLILRRDAGGTLTNAEMKAAVEPYADAEILYSVDGSNNLTVGGASTELYVAANHSYTPGGTVNTVHVKVMGTVLPGANMWNVSGSWDSSSGTWWPQTSSVNLTGTGTLAQYVVATPWMYGFNDLSLAAAGQTTTLTSTNLWVNRLTTGTGAFTDGPSSYVVVLQGVGDVFVDGGAALDLAGLNYRAGDYTQNVIGRDYTGIGTLKFDTVGGAAGSGVYELQGNLAANAVEIRINNTDGNARNSILNTNGHTLTATSLKVGVDGRPQDYGVLNAGASVVDINGPVVIYPSDANGDNAINAGSSTWTVAGAWTNGDVFSAGTSSVTLDGTGQALAGDTTFYALSKTAAAADTLTFAAGSTTAVGQALTLEGADGNLLGLRSSAPGTRWNLTLAAGATQTVGYVDVQDSDASGSDAALKPVNPSDSVNSGNNVAWFYDLVIVKQAWEESGAAPLGSPVTAAAGAQLVFLVYVKNPNASAVTDVRINDSLDEAGFSYIGGSLVRTSAGSPPPDTATDKQIFDATAPGTGTAVSDAVDADPASAQDTGGGAGVDKVTVGAVAAQPNASLTVPKSSTFGLRFVVQVK